MDGYEAYTLGEGSRENLPIELRTKSFFFFFCEPVVVEGIKTNWDGHYWGNRAR